MSVLPSFQICDRCAIERSLRQLLRVWVHSGNRRRVEQGDVVVQFVLFGPGVFFAAGHV